MKSRREFCFTVLCLLGLALTSLVNIGHSKEMEVTKEWQLVGENDTIPAGMHIRMDMTTGEKWVKQLDDDEDESEEPAGTAAKATTAVVNGDGSLQIIEQEEEEKEEDATTTTEGKTEATNYDYEMMYRTLSQLPKEEKQRMGGIPELPQTKGSSSPALTAKEREAFEKRMSEIWEMRQAELKELEEQIVDLPEVLKERIASIKGYLADPSSHLKSIDLDNDNNDTPTHFVSILEDLEFLLTDIDMTRDFHTLGGWAVLVSLLSEESHFPQNKTISTLSAQLEANARAVQAHAAWAIGTAVKNTGEFFPLAIEKVPTRNGGTTTAIDLLADVLCNSEYKDADALATRNLLSKSVYAIGSLLRGNRIAQVYTSRTDIPTRLGEKLRELTIARFSSSTTKLVQRLVSLAGDIVSDVNLHSEGLDDDIKEAIIRSYTSQDWCDSLSTLLTTDTFLPLNVEETLLESVTVSKPYCEWGDRAADFRKAITTMQGEWENNRDDFDHDHLEHLTELARRAYESFDKQA